MKEALNGPKLVAWIEERADLEGFPSKNPSQARRMLNWRLGGQADIGTADHILIILGLHLSQLPDNFYEPHCRASHCHDEALDLYREGMRPNNIAAQLHVDPSTVSSWVKKAGLTRNPQPKKEAA